MGISDFFAGRRQRDGSSPDNAIVVDSGPEEYKWIARHRPGFKLKFQALIDVNGKPYDALTLYNKKGEEQTVYFDISKFYGAEPSDAEIQAMKKNIEKMLQKRKSELKRQPT